MLKFDAVDAILRAISDPTCRAIVERLGRSPASVSDLAKPFDMSLAAVVQHIQVLEDAGVVASEKIGRVRTCRLASGGMTALSLWIDAQKSPVERRLDRLDAFLDEDGEGARRRVKPRKKEKQQ